MNEHMETYRIRPGMPEDLPLLPTIILPADELFRVTPYAYLLDSRPTMVTVDSKRERFWVAVDSSDALVGVVIVLQHQRAVHVDQLAVHPTHGRRGLGTQLLEAVAAWARLIGKSGLTLTTFADIPWNGPYYERRGFRILVAEEMDEELAETMRHEIESGLPSAQRIAMRREL